MYECQLGSCSSADIRTLRMTTSSCRGSQARILCSLHDSEALLFCRLSRGPSFPSPVALAVPATQTQRGSLTQTEACTCQSCLDQAHRESKPQIGLLIDLYKEICASLIGVNAKPLFRTRLHLVSWRIDTTSVQASIPEIDPLLTCGTLHAPEDEWFNH